MIAGSRHGSSSEQATGLPTLTVGAVEVRYDEDIAKVKKQFRVGNLYVNRKCTGALVDRQPFGGFKLSGIGSKAGGPDYLLQFLQIALPHQLHPLQHWPHRLPLHELDCNC